MKPLFSSSSSGFTDELAWAAIWLYRATNNINYLNDATRFYTTYSLMRFPNDFSWDNKTAAVQVLLFFIFKVNQIVFFSDNLYNIISRF